MLSEPVFLANQIMIKFIISQFQFFTKKVKSIPTLCPNLTLKIRKRLSLGRKMIIKDKQL